MIKIQTLLLENIQGKKVISDIDNTYINSNYIVAIKEVKDINMELSQNIIEENNISDKYYQIYMTNCVLFVDDVNLARIVSLS